MQEMEEAEAERGEMEEEERDEAMEEVKGEGIENMGNGAMRIPEEEDPDKTGIEAQEEEGARRQPNKITTASSILDMEEAKLAKARAEMKTRITMEGKRAVKIFANRRK
jgi:hypothetical protein